MKKIYAMIVMMAMTLTASAQEAEVASPYDNGLSVKIAAEADKFTLTARDQEPLTIAIPKQARAKKGDVVLTMDGTRLVYAIVTDIKNPLKPTVVLMNAEYEDNDDGTPKVESKQLESGTFAIVKAQGWAPGARVAIKSSRWHIGKMVCEKDGKVLVLLKGEVQAFKKADVKLLPQKELLKPGDEVKMTRARMSTMCMDGWKVKKVNAGIGRVWITFGPDASPKIVGLVDVTKAIKD